MTLQGYFDESEDEQIFVLAGYISTEEDWARFSEEWKEMLPYATKARNGEFRFKLSEMSSLFGITKVPAFYRIIERNIKCAVSVSIFKLDLISAMRRIIVSGRPVNWTKWADPYAFTFRVLTDAIIGRRHDIKFLAERDEAVEFFFDEGRSEGAISKAWKAIYEVVPEELKKYYQRLPRFENDDVFLPLQAADFWAGWMRKSIKGYGTFDFDGVPVPWDIHNSGPELVGIEMDEDAIMKFLLNYARHFAGKAPIYVLPKIPWGK